MKQLKGLVMVNFLISLFSLLFIITTCSNGASLEDVLNKLENDLKTKKSETIIQKDLKTLQEVKKTLPVNYIPEINYLMKKEIEKIPESGITNKKKELLISSIIYNSSIGVMFLIVVFTLTFFFQQVNTRHRNILSVFSIFLSSISVIYKPFFFFLVGTAIVFNLRLRKPVFTIFLMLFSVISLLSQNIYNNASAYVSSYSTLYKEKIERDGYVPYYLIDKVFSDSKKETVEKIINQLAVGNFENIKVLKNIAENSNNEELKIAALNGLGYFYFMKGDYEKAEKYFLKANGLSKSPIPEINLYFTYSATLQVDKAAKMMEKLKRNEQIVIPDKPVPLLIHLQPRPLETKVAWNTIIALSVGLLLAYILVSKIPFEYGFFNRSFRKIPGIGFYINNGVAFFILIFIVFLVTNYIVVGKLLC
ncbi:MAG: hypothetical protein ABGX27_00635 [Desulfurobacteriaceae bacterium]